MLTDLIIFSWSRTLGTKHTKRNTKLTEKGKKWVKIFTDRKDKGEKYGNVWAEREKGKKKGKGRIILRLL